VGELRSAAHAGGCRPANFGTVFIKPDAFGHHLDVILLQAGFTAMLAFQGAADAGFNTRLVFVMGHRTLLSLEFGKNLRCDRMRQ
jgi:hypothetical protein